MNEALRFIHVIEELLRGGHTVRFRAPGGSMHPTIRNNDSITVAPLGALPVRVGDVVLYRRGRAAIAHRVVQLQAACGRSAHVVLRGDAEPCCDRPVAIANVLGRVTGVERGSRTRGLDVLGPMWSRALGRTLRVTHELRRRATGIVIRRTTTLQRVL